MSHTSNDPRDLDALLDEGVRAVRDDAPSPDAVRDATSRVWARLSAEAEASPEPSTSTPATGCDAVREMLPAYLAGELSAERALLVRDHSRDCIPCRRALAAARRKDSGEVAEPTAPAVANDDRATGWGALRLAAAAGFAALLTVALLVATGIVPFGSSVAAEVASLDGDLFLVDGTELVALTPGAEIRRGREVMTAAGSGAVLRLADGSLVELAARSRLAVHPGMRSTTVDLGRGAVVVQAAERARGNLFVDTEDMRVAVTGTIFSVDHGVKGSRVSVIEGEVVVDHGRDESVLQPGQQVTTGSTLPSVRVSESVAWSRDAERWAAMLDELEALRASVALAAPAPAPRTATTLLDRAPAATKAWVAGPNISDEVADARAAFQAGLASSPALSEALEARGENAWNAELQDGFDRMIGRVLEYGRYLGPEVAVAAVNDAGFGDEPGLVAYAEVLDPAGLASLIESQAGDGVVLIDDPAQAGDGSGEILYVWIGDGLVAVSPEAELLAAVAGPTAGGFAGTDLHAEIAERYERGVEWLMAVDVASSLPVGDDAPPSWTGFDDVESVIAEWRETGPRPEAVATVRFGGPRHGVASWLAEPAAMGSLSFVSRDAAAVAAVLTRDPAEIAEELWRAMVAESGEVPAEAEQVAGLARDLAASLGGEAALAVDGPLAPEPGVLLVVEVTDATRLQLTLEQALVGLVDEDGQQRLHVVATRVANRPGYRIETAEGTVVLHYVYAEGYLLAARQAGLVGLALDTRASGLDVTTAPRLRELLPEDGQVHFSAVAFQDLGAKLAPVADRLARSEVFGPEQRAALSRARELAPPTLAYAYGGTDSISFAGSLGGDSPFSLPAFLGSGGALGIGPFSTLLGGDGLGFDVERLEELGAAGDAEATPTS